MKVLGTLIRVFIERDAMDKTIKFYEELYHTSCTERGYYEGLNLELAIVDKAVIIAGDAESRKLFESARATLLVDSIQDTMRELQQRGATLLTQPKRTPGSWIMLMQHPDGLIAEYVERIS